MGCALRPQGTIYRVITSKNQPYSHTSYVSTASSCVLFQNDTNYHIHGMCDKSFIIISLQTTHLQELRAVSPREEDGGNRGKGEQEEERERGGEGEEND